MDGYYYNANEKKEKGSVLVILGGYDMMMVLFANRAAVVLAGAAQDRETPRSYTALSGKIGITERKSSMRNGIYIGMLAAVLALGGCGTDAAPLPEPITSVIQKDPITKSDFLLNTFVTVTIYDSQDEALLEESMELCREYEGLLSKTVESSEISAINHRETGTDRVAVSDATAELIGEGLEFSKLSDGAFDITIEPVSSLWDFTSGQALIPDQEELAKAVEQVDYRKVSVDGNQVVLASPGTRIELGAIAKGYIADRIKEYLMGEGVESAIINLGGNVLCVGEKPDGSAFKIGLQKPFKDRNETIAVLNIRDQSVVTSGVYERHFEKDGVNYHHILNPEDGYPYDNGLLSVTIVSPRSVDGDGLSTTCFSLGLEKGMALVDSMPEVYGYFITEDYEVHASEGANELLQGTK